MKDISDIYQENLQGKKFFIFIEFFIESNKKKNHSQINNSKYILKKILIINMRNIDILYLELDTYWERYSIRIQSSIKGITKKNW